MREELAQYSHEVWAQWMKYLFSECEENDDGSVTIPAEFISRWDRQLNTLYKDLPENEKESDRAEADKIIKIIMTVCYG